MLVDLLKGSSGQNQIAEISQVVNFLPFPSNL